MGFYVLGIRAMVRVLGVRVGFCFRAYYFVMHGYRVRALGFRVRVLGFVVTVEHD